MHEVSVVQSLLALVERYGGEYGLSRVTKVVVGVGDQAGVCQDSLRFAFDAVSQGTLADGAAFVLETVPGGELTLQSLEGEQPDEAVGC